MTRIPFALALFFAGSACVSTQEAAHDPAQRKPLLDSLKSLEGTWEKKGDKGEVMTTEFKVTAAGSAVREIMFPGTAQEMTNVYCLEGNALALTHYCAMGNQPHMRAAARKGNQLPFTLASVSDLESPDEMYMGEMTLEFVDQDHICEHWRTYVKGVLQKDEGVDIALTRRK
jgi:hypothetical protein